MTVKARFTMETGLNVHKNEKKNDKLTNKHKSHAILYILILKIYKKIQNHPT